jgi:2-polyprenyl-3-methyl-5-hydroxy-6-metoxy-1,4-benzoquinol methylase
MIHNDHNEYFASNRELWDKLTAINAKSPMYDMEAFKRGQSTLDPIEIAELGDVRGKSILHLQCHFGQDTMSLARMGAQVTGVDFSDEAIKLAKSLSEELAIPAEFICCNIYDLPKHLDKQFDIVFTSAGVLCWINDLQQWAQLIDRYLKLDGTFYLREFHPIEAVFDMGSAATELKAINSYFHKAEPEVWDTDWAYSDHQAKLDKVCKSCEWQHPLADVINALLSVNLKLEFLHEFPYCSYDCFPFLEKGADGRWRFPGGKELIPLMFSLKATKY